MQKEGERKEKEGQPGLEIRKYQHRQQHRQLLEGGERKPTGEDQSATGDSYTM